MSVSRQMPKLGPPTKTTEAGARRQPRLPSGCAPVPARGPKLDTTTAIAGSR